MRAQHRSDNASPSEKPAAARVVARYISVQLFRPSVGSATLTPYGCDRVDEVFEHLKVVHDSAHRRYRQRHASRFSDYVPLTIQVYLGLDDQARSQHPLLAGTLADSRLAL